jgi:hypothetical protein
VRRLVRDVVADYSERSLNSALPPIADPESVVRDLLDRVPASDPCSVSANCRSRPSPQGLVNLAEHENLDLLLR